MACIIVVQPCRSREATENCLGQRRLARWCRAPYSLNSMVESRVDLHTRMVDCYRNGCVAFTADRETLFESDKCNAARYRADGQAVKQATYWPLLRWLKVMLAKANIRPSIVKFAKEAR